MEKERFWEVDLLRGLAIIFVIFYHTLFDLCYFGVLDPKFQEFPMWHAARIVASAFVLLVGVSLSLSHARRNARGEKDPYARHLKRGITIFSFGFGITIVTWIFIGSSYIAFGILHLIGVSIILAYHFLERKIENLVLGLAIFAAGLAIDSVRVDTSLFLWLGLKPAGYYTVDYFPILPWFGLVLIGIFLGNVLYPDYKRRFTLPDLSGNVLVKPFLFLGRHTLLIYIAHQPVILVTLYLLGVPMFGL